MSSDRPRFRLSPRPPLRKAERGSTLVFLFGVLVAACKPSPPSVVLATDSHLDLRGEVQAFYDWYSDTASLDRSTATVLAVLPQVLSPDLRTLLQADEKCKDASQSICNIEFDPFLNSQDPCARYEVRAPVPHGDTLAFPIYPNCAWMRDTAPALIALALPLDSGWVFTNFIYGGGSADLRTILSRPVTE